MKLDYFDLLSPEPIQIQNVGGIISPTLRDICSIGYNTYQTYLTILSMDLKLYLKMIGKEETYYSISEEEKSNLNIFELIILSKDYCFLLQNALDFFIKETVIFSSENSCFLVKSNDKIIGQIGSDAYKEICNIICQRNNIKSTIEEDLSKIKSKKALEIMNKLQKGRIEKNKHNKSDKNLEIGNIVSAVANKSQSLNILNIWDLTIFQLWDSFQRLSNNHIYDIQSTSVAVWGNKDNYFDATAWFKRLDDKN